MIQRVIERAFESSAQNVFVAVDDERIASVVQAASDAKVCRTRSDHVSGTDRVAEAVTRLGLSGDRIVVNVQGDEPLICAKLIDKVAAALLEHPDAEVSTAASPITSQQDWTDSNVVKCAIDCDGYALYFSRCSIPYGTSQTGSRVRGLHHIGIYAYRAGYLVEHAKRPACKLELTERLEQLRVLFNGDRIAVHVDENYKALGVDTAEDLARVVQMVNADKQ